MWFGAGFSRDINGVLAVEYYSGEEFSQAIQALLRSSRTTRTSIGG